MLARAVRGAISEPRPALLVIHIAPRGSGRDKDGALVPAGSGSRAQCTRSAHGGLQCLQTAPPDHPVLARGEFL